MLISVSTTRPLSSTPIKTRPPEELAKTLNFLMEQARKGRGDAEEIAGYRHIKMLGEGGIGQVWLVEEETIGKQMALKLMLPNG